MTTPTASRYVLLVSLYDRLGGHVLRWSKLRGQEWGAVTLPLGHGGHYYNTDMKVETVCRETLPPSDNFFSVCSLIRVSSQCYLLNQTSDHQWYSSLSCLSSEGLPRPLIVS